MKKFIVLLAAMALFAGCSQFSADNEKAAAVEQAVLSAFSERFPSATDVVWSEDGSDWMASFYVENGTETKGHGNGHGKHHCAWFDHQGHWKMTEVEQELTELPEPVQTAYAQSDYAEWELKGASSIERNDIILLYLIEAVDYADSVLVENVAVNDSTSVEKRDTVNYLRAKVELYYSETGYLVKENLKEYSPRIDNNDCDGDGHHSHVSSEKMDSVAVAKVNAYIDETYPGAEVVESYCDWDGATVSIVYNGENYELFFSRKGEIYKTYQTVEPSALPEKVVAALDKVFAECDSTSILSSVKVTRTEQVPVYYKIKVYYEYTVEEDWHHGNGHGNGHHNSEPRTYSDKMTLRITEEGKVL